MAGSAPSGQQRPTDRRGGAERRSRAKPGAGGGAGEGADRRTAGSPARGGFAGWVGALIPAAALTMAFGFFAWAIGGPSPVDAAQSRTAGKDPLEGLATALAAGALCACALVVVCTLWSAARAWRDRLVLASGGLYLAASYAALGSKGLVLAAAASLAAVAALGFLKKEVEADGLILAVHAGAFGAALCLYHEWPRFAAGWEPFRQNLAALRALWF